MQANTSYDELICHLAVYQNKMAAQNAALQAQLSQVTQQLSWPSQHEVELARSSKP